MGKYQMLHGQTVPLSHGKIQRILTVCSVGIPLWVSWCPPPASPLPGRPCTSTTRYNKMFHKVVVVGNSTIQVIGKRNWEIYSRPKAGKGNLYSWPGVKKLRKNYVSRKICKYECPWIPGFFLKQSGKSGISENYPPWSLPLGFWLWPLKIRYCKMILLQ